MEEAKTCGKGLAENSELPAKASELFSALAGNLVLHMESLVADDENTRREHEAYDSLSKQHQAVADQLAAVAGAMSACRDLPMGAHDEQVFADPRLLEAFERFVAAEQAMLTSLQQRLERDRAMLEGWRQAITKG